MSAPVARDPAVPVVGMVMGALLDAFKGESSFPPANPTERVYFFAGEGPATAAFDAHSNSAGCDSPFVWVRAVRRYRTNNLPEPVSDTYTCDAPRAITLEVGVARCAVVAAEPSPEDYEDEAVTSLEDSWRVEKALCAAVTRLKADDYATALEEISPFGPEGGIIAWTGIIHIQFAN